MKIYVVENTGDGLKAFKLKEKALIYKAALNSIDIPATMFETELVI